MTVTVLRAGFDTIEVSFSGHFSEEAIKRLDAAKERALGTDAEASLSVGFVELQMMPKAYGFWTWRLTEPRFHIVGKRNAANGAAVAQIRFSAFGLVNEHPSLLVRLAVATLSELGDFEQLAVSRADVCVDFQGWVPTPAEMVNLVTPVSYRAQHGTEKQVQTFQFGKRTLLRVYDKTAEIEVSHKNWLMEVWSQHAWFDAAAPVWRIEFQAKSEVLKQLGITRIEHLLDQPGALLDYGLRYAQLRVPTADATKTRWVEDVRWTALRQATFDGRPLQRRVSASALMSLDDAKRRLVGLAALAGAYFETTDYMDALQRLSFATEAHMMHEDVDFAALVESKRRRILAGGGGS